jgi:prevent-host-death family protein
VKTISQRELRNDNAAIMRGVEAGESYVVTRNGVPVARLIPLPSPSLPVARPARRRLDLSSLPRIELEMSSQELLDEVREDR